MTGSVSPIRHEFTPLASSTPVAVMAAGLLIETCLTPDDYIDASDYIRKGNAGDIIHVLRTSEGLIVAAADITHIGYSPMKWASGIAAFAVHPSYRRQGLGTRLMAHIGQQTLRVKHDMLWMDGVTEAEGRGFAQTLGFKPDEYFENRLIARAVDVARPELLG